MKKKVFSLMMMLLLAVTGFVRADELTVHDGTATNSYVPVYGFYADAYLKCEMVYPASELGAMNGGEISGLTFGISSPATEAWTGTFQVFVKEVSSATIDAFTGTTGATVVYTGTLDGTGSTMTVNFSTPYTYNGGNLLVGFYLTSTGNYKSVTWVGETVTGASVQGYSYSDLGSISATQRDFLPKTTFTYSGGSGGGGGVVDNLHIKYVDADGNEVVDQLDLGVRPINAWMEPFEFTMYSEGPTYTINVLDFTPSDGMFIVGGQELPFQVNYSTDADLTLVTDGDVEGTIDRQFVAITEGDRAAHIWPITVEMYTPEIPDVVEKPHDFGNVGAGFSYVGIPANLTPTTLHNDYTLPFPEIPEGVDGVYKMTFTEDVMLNASVSTGADGKVALYTEDFYGEGGPMATNYYQGPSVGGGGGAASGPFEAQIGEGTSTSGYLPFYCFYNYSISQQLFLAAELSEAGVTRAPMTSLSWYCTGSNGNMQSNITIWMANVEDTSIGSSSVVTGSMAKVYEGNMTPVANQWNEFVFNQGTFAWDGHSNVLVSVQRNNGAWASGINWQVGAQSFNASVYKYTDSTGAGYGPFDMTANTYSGTATTSRANIIMKSERGRDARATVPVTVTMHDSYGDGWNGGFLIISADGDEQTVQLTDGYEGTEVVDIHEGAHVQLIWSSAMFDGDISFEVSIDGTTIYSVTAPEHGLLYEFDAPAVAVPVEIPEGISYGPIVAHAPVAAGTYYLVASSTTPNFEVTIGAELMPCPDVDGFAFSPSPADDEDDVDPASVRLQWMVPDYATGWRLVFGSTYYPDPNHPQTII